MNTVIGSRKLLARIGSAMLSAALAGVILGFFGTGPLAWGSPYLWVFVAVDSSPWFHLSDVPSDGIASATQGGRLQRKPSQDFPH
jgi:hypothetical protein